jgi:hypothetical protein
MGVPKDDDWRFFTQLMYDNIDTLADKPGEIVTRMKSHEARQQHEVNFESIELLALAKTRTKTDKQRPTLESRKTRDSLSERNRSSAENKKHVNCGTKWRDTQECYRCHKVGHIARYCPSTAQVEITAQKVTAAAPAAATTRTSMENYWISVTN